MSVRRQPGPWGYVAAMLANGVMLLIVNLHPVWRPWTHGVVTDAWAQVVWAANLSAGLQIAGSALLLCVRPPLLQRLTKLSFSCVGVVAAVVFYVTYPLDFTRVGVGWLDPAVRGVLLLGVIGASLAVVVDLVRLAFPRPGGPHPTPVSGSGT